MKKKMTFYVDESWDAKLMHWQHQYLAATGKKLTKSAVIDMLLHALLENIDLKQMDLKQHEIIHE